MVIKVVLSKPSLYYTIGPNNPEVGTDYECEGIVETVGGGKLYYSSNWRDFDMSRVTDVIEGRILDRDGIFIEVSWDNGNFNTYSAGELTVCNNRQPKCVSIW